MFCFASQESSKLDDTLSATSVILLLATLARVRREDLSLQVFWLAVVMLFVFVKDWFVFSLHGFFCFVFSS